MEIFLHLHCTFVLSEMAALGIDKVLCVCYTGESTTVLEVKFSQVIWDKIYNVVHNSHGKETPSRPTKQLVNIFEFKTDIEEFVKSSVSLLYELQLSKGVECQRTKTEANASFCFHNNLDTDITKNKQRDIKTVQTWLHEFRMCLEFGFQLTRSCASEFLVFKISDYDRFFNQELQ